MENEYWKKKKDEMLKMKAVVMEFGKDQWAQFSQSARQCRARCYDSLAPSIDKVFFLRFLFIYLLFIELFIECIKFSPTLRHNLRGKKQKKKKNRKEKVHVVDILVVLIWYKL
ncbi:hypothetical protein TorRG33x02_286530 [Trema orientale]|uniref:Uncharacterized protein n=1 Tax=Trema orientale TaxID=63057 RepID=A0A2P5CFM0_TREOI|nr:hypothetical protein TorRG33x02_286530 [Trema orientale]